MSATLDRPVPVDPDVPVDPARTPLARTVPPDLAESRALHHRLNDALADLGLDDVLTTRWATPARSGFFFAPHNLQQAHRLVIGLERLGSLVDGLEGEARQEGSRPGPGQLAFALTDDRACDA